jgi:hypothetical protein
MRPLAVRALCRRLDPAALQAVAFEVNGQACDYDTVSTSFNEEIYGKVMEAAADPRPGIPAAEVRRRDQRARGRTTARKVTPGTLRTRIRPATLSDGQIAH